MMSKHRFHFSSYYRMLIGISIVVLNIVLVVSAIIWNEVRWARSRPKEFIRGVGIRYGDGARAWKGMECLINSIHGQITAIYDQQFADTFMSNIIIDVVGPDGSQKSRTTIVSEANKIAGSIDHEQKYPWSRQKLIAIVLQRRQYTHAYMGATTHEIIKHLLPIYRGEGHNTDHARKDLDALAAAIDRSCADASD
jgi:hypothetical protein